MLGESIAVNGVCLTVAEYTDLGDAFFFISLETLERSNLGSVKVGSFLNLERALTLQTRLSGHLVQGHVDGKARLRGIIACSNSTILSFELDPEIAHYCVEKGSISINGISLTINSLSESLPDEKTLIEVMIIPHTWSNTNLSHLQVNDQVNVEVDILAKYVERLCSR